jgi:hypothetical protein
VGGFAEELHGPGTECPKVSNEIARNAYPEQLFWRVFGCFWYILLPQAVTVLGQPKIKFLLLIFIINICKELSPLGSQYLHNTFIRVGATCCSASIVVWELYDCVTYICMHPQHHAGTPCPNKSILLDQDPRYVTVPALFHLPVRVPVPASFCRYPRALVWSSLRSERGQ